MPYQEEAKKILHLFLSRLMLKEKKEFLLLNKNWGVISDELDSLVLKLASQDNLSEDKLFRLALYKQFQEEARNQIQIYSNIASGIISENQKVFGETGLVMTQKQIEIRTSFFNHLPVDRINNFIGKSYYDGSKLEETLFARSYPDYMKNVKDKLLTGVALGKNPKAVAKWIKNESTAPLWESLRLARTEQLNILRQTSELQMKESGVVDGLQRIEAVDACDYCKSVNGNIYEFGEPQDDYHPNCRGTVIPYFKN